MKKLCNLVPVSMILLICVGLLGMGSVAKATLIPMDVNDTYTAFGEFDLSHDGLERRFSYEVTNLGNSIDTIGPYLANSMKQFEISAGSEDGIYSASAPTGWTTTILGDRTIFQAGTYSDYIKPSNLGIFGVYSSYSGVNGGGSANAQAILKDFEVETICVPVPEPAMVVLLAIGSLIFGYGKKRSRK
ncbi:MAG: PEP-CTERM sorting domain-containing protein [Nanoarchaeota archaeon]|nr:PEP-CTERM sorting domain-containing protein [Nanoarchaeota archaeon]